MRFLAVLLFSAAGLVPVLDAVGLFQSGPVLVPASLTVTQEALDSLARDRFESGQLGYLFAAVAAALIGLDKFLGFSSSWTRYITAELSIQKSLDRFRIDWAIANAKPADDADKPGPGERLQILKDFSMEVSRIIEEETQVWVREFQSALLSMEKAIQEREQAARPGSIELAIDRSDGVQSMVKVLVNGQVRQTTAAQSIAVHGVRPGETDIQLIGTLASGEEVMASRIVTLPSGSTASVTMKLG